MKEKYAAILDRPPPESRRHPRMSNRDRAAQFAPFAALKTFEESTEETARQTGERKCLTEEAAAQLDRSLQLLRDHLDQRPQVQAVYFQPDGRKAGGAYVTVRGRAVGLRLDRRVLLLGEGQEIPLEELFSLELPEHLGEAEMQQGGLHNYL